jgi:hypothetical protein
MLGPSVSVAQDIDHLSRSQTDTTHLFDGRRVEDFLIDDDDSSACSTSSASSVISEEDEAMSQDGQFEELIHRSLSSSISNAEVPGTPQPESGSASQITSAISEHSSGGVSLENQVLASQLNVPDLQLDHMSFTAEEAAEKEASMLNLLQSLRNPQMSIEYLENFHMCFNYILRVWREAPVVERKRQMGILARLQRGMARAEVLRSMCDLESQGPVFSNNLGYRDSLLKAIGTGNSSFQNELQSLGDAVSDAMTLFSSAIDAKTTAAVDIAKKVLRERREALRSTKKEKIHTEQAVPLVTEKSILPFLTWTWLSSEPDQGDEAEHFAAEFLSATMRDIERSLVHRGETSYKYARELTLPGLDAARSKQGSQTLGITDDTTTPMSSPRTPIRPGSQTITAHLSSPLRHSIGDLFAVGEILRARSGSMNAALDQLFASAKRFVELYIPSNFNHPVCHKIWGSLASMMVCNSSPRFVISRP